ncbi:MAG: L-seryl-tRNA(Sec) selenium transferase [Dehalococcoidia bacterium]|nr:L-seryl-tRNA(Sec) selenium transferase [Dehalococcoidia bacterium]
MKSEFRSLPSVDKLLSDARIRELEVSYSRSLVVEVVRQVLEDCRQSISRGEPAPSSDNLVEAVSGRVRGLVEPTLQQVVNATGVIIHTNLGRAPLSREAIAAMEEASRGYSNLEFDLQVGVRGHRDVHITSLLCRVTGAEDAMAVNNNASAVLLTLTALCKKKEVIVSRGQAVEIGGGFRIPDVMRQSGAKLVEVGTTNCTYVSDYEQAITPRTAALLRVHSSNFKLVGFVEDVAIGDLVQLGNKNNLPVFDDLGSGCLLDTTKYGLSPEPRVQDSVAAGVALAMFSGDKLLGGPQAGIIVGRQHLVAKLRKHPLARAVRIDKTRLAGLAVTLTHYLKGEAEQKIPVWRMIAAPVDEIERRAKAWAEALGPLGAVADGESVVGGGSLPGSTLPTKLVVIKGPTKGPSLAQSLAQSLRANRPPVVARIEGNALLLDPRTVLPGEDQAVIEALCKAATAIKR